MVGKNCDFQGVKGLHFGHLNVRSLWNKYNLIKPLIQLSNITMVSFSETWLHSDIDSNMINIPGYICSRLDRSWTENNVIKKGGGVCCHPKNDVCMSDIEFKNFNRSCRDIEILWISINIPNCKKIIIGTSIAHLKEM